MFGASLVLLAGVGLGMLPACPLGRYNEVNAINTACSNGLEECKRLVTRLFQQWMDNPQSNP